MTLYQLELLSPLGVWTPCGPPARSMTAATLAGLRIVSPRDMRVVQMIVISTPPEMMTVTCRFDTETANSVSLED